MLKKYIQKWPENKKVIIRKLIENQKERLQNAEIKIENQQEKLQIQENTINNQEEEKNRYKEKLQSAEKRLTFLDEENKELKKKQIESAKNLSDKNLMEKYNDTSVEKKIPYEKGKPQEIPDEKKYLKKKEYMAKQK